MNRLRLFPLFWSLLACASASPVPPPAPPPPAPAPEPFVFPYTSVWTREADTPLRGEGGVSRVPRPFTRLDVIRVDSAGVYVRCAACGGGAAGRVDTSAVVFRAGTPEEAARGELAEFLLAVREAAARRDAAALRPVMSELFTHSPLLGGDGRLEALAAWERERFRALDHLPALLDRGVATRDERLWVAPPEYLEADGYRGYRTGFRRADRGWEWVFLVQ